jgi:thioredoxin 1
MVISLSKQNSAEVLEQSSKPVIIDIFATWCGPCKMVKPEFEKVAKELGDKFTFAELNVDEARDLAVQFGVTSVPTFVFYKDKQVKGKVVGYRSAEDLKADITKYLG